MKKLLIIALLVWGCENNPTASTPLIVGVWEVVERKVSTSTNLSFYSYASNEWTWTFRDDETMTITTVDEDGQSSSDATYFAIDGKLTVYDEDMLEPIEYDYTLTECIHSCNILILSIDFSNEECVTCGMTMTLQRQ